MGKLISLESILGNSVDNAVQKALNHGGCASTACGTTDTKDSMEKEVWDKIKDHPCYSEEAHHYFARMHVAVAPACNIQCNYCNRKYDCSNESRPGVVSEKLTPEQAKRKVLAVASEVPQMSVLGIAGPGDSCYDWKKTKATFELIHAEIPDIKLCLSTNGLALPDHVDEIANMNIDHVTVTINMVDPEVGARIYPWVFYKNKRVTGLEAAQILHERQMLSLDMLRERKILVKVNSVMIPGINDEHLAEVNRVVKEKGAFLHNIMPLISDPAHGTYFGLNGQRGPTAAELKRLQDKVAEGTKLMRHCRQCRADAVGLLGEDRGQEFTMENVDDDVKYNPAKREAYLKIVAKERGEHIEQRKDVSSQLKETVEADESLVVAIATKGGGRINQHFGHAKEFQVYEITAKKGVEFIGHRKVDQYCQGGWGEDASLEGVIKALEGCAVVLCAKIGDCPKDSLKAANIDATDEFAQEWIEQGIVSWYTKRQAAKAAAPAESAAVAAAE